MTNNTKTCPECGQKNLYQNAISIFLRQGRKLAPGTDESQVPGPALGACLKKVASAILADVEPWLPARRIGVSTDKNPVNSRRFARQRFFPGGRMPPSTAGKDACRHIFRQALRENTGIIKSF